MSDLRENDPFAAGGETGEGNDGREEALGVSSEGMDGREENQGISLEETDGEKVVENSGQDIFDLNEGIGMSENESWSDSGNGFKNKMEDMSETESGCEPTDKSGNYTGNGSENTEENFGDIVVQAEALAEAAKEKKRAGKRGKLTPEEKLIRSEKRVSWIWGFLFGILACLLLFAGVDYYRLQLQQETYNSANSSTSTSNDTLLTNGDEILEKLQTIQALIDTYFLYDVDEETVVESLYAALLDSLGDPYSVYYTAEEYADLMESGSGTYYGIGVEVTQSTETGVITVTRVFEDCPGAEAGMEVGDIIIAVDGVSTEDTDLSTVVTWIKGEEYTTVDITVERDGEEITMTVERRQVDNETVTSEMLDNSVGYVAVEEFDSVTVSQFETALEELAEAGMQGLIIDLRGNPGGYLDVCVDMLDYLLPEGLLVYTEDKYGNRDEYTSDADANLTDIPIVILIDGSSASASEVFTGAMQDYERATVVGTQSFGKGIVQSIFSLGDGSGMKITVSNYYTPNGNNIHGIGITPDVVVEPDDTTEDDEQLEAAIEVLLEEMGD
ncbi:MAG: S41 family peptidase [Lachnospiraceae bacterium]|nr:S41 family peptidase [Lachnospiraceae bacterium]